MKNLKNFENYKFITIDQIKIGDIVEYSMDYRKQTIIVDNIIIRGNKAKIEARNYSSNTSLTLYISDLSQKEYFKIIGKSTQDELQK